MDNLSKEELFDKLVEFAAFYFGRPELKEAFRDYACLLLNSNSSERVNKEDGRS